MFSDRLFWHFSSLFGEMKQLKQLQNVTNGTCKWQLLLPYQELCLSFTTSGILGLNTGSHTFPKPGVDSS